MKRRISRRDFLAASAVAGLSLPARAGIDEAVYQGQYLRAEKTSSALLGPGAPETRHWHLRNAEGLPLLRARQGQEFRFRLFNEVDEDFYLHFFGLRGPSTAMTVHLLSGNTSSEEVVFTPPDAGTYWFGPLVKASRQRELGLVGMLIVDEATPTGFHDVPLILDDWKLSDDGVIDPDFGNLEAAAGEGRLGNWFTVNGKLKPRIVVDASSYVRLRLLNVANTRTMNVQFKNAELVIVSKDGQPIKPTLLGNEGLALAPGQRVDLIVTESYDDITLFIEQELDAVEAAFIIVPPEVTKPLPIDFQLPGNPIAVVDTNIVPRLVPLVIEGGLKGGLVSARVGDVTLDLRTMLERGLAWAVNGIAGPSGVAVFEAQKGETLILEINNKTKFEQPLHIHSHVWHLLSLNGIAADGQSWRDTVVVPAETIAKCLCIADNPGDWAIQSLIAERSDAGLFANFKVVG